MTAHSEDYVAINKASWDERVPAHVESVDYAVERLLAGPDELSDVVAFDQPRLGDLVGLRGVHLQCHIGTDTLSLARLGGQMSGLDFSEPAIDAAQDLARRAGVEIDYQVAEVYDALGVFEPESFDFVFTGIGALCWLPSIERWADVVVGLLNPGGKLFLREGHPMLWTIDEEQPGLQVHYPYFESEGNVMDSWGTYVDTQSVFATTRTVDFSHGLGEIFTALLDRGMQITRFEEHDSAPWAGIPDQMVRDAPFGEWRLAERRERLPLTYTLHAVRTS